MGWGEIGWDGIGRDGMGGCLRKGGALPAREKEGEQDLTTAINNNCYQQQQALTRKPFHCCKTNPTPFPRNMSPERRVHSRTYSANHCSEIQDRKKHSRLTGNIKSSIGQVHRYAGGSMHRSAHVVPRHQQRERKDTQKTQYVT